MEAKDGLLVKISNRWSLEQLSALETQLLEAVPGHRVLWAGAKGPQRLAEYLVPDGSQRPQEDFRSPDWLQQEVIYVALGWLGGTVASHVVDHAVAATVEAVKRWLGKEDPPRSVIVIILGAHGKELRRQRLASGDDDPGPRDHAEGTDPPSSVRRKDKHRRES